MDLSYFFVGFVESSSKVSCFFYSALFEAVSSFMLVAYPL